MASSSTYHDSSRSFRRLPSGTQSTFSEAAQILNSALGNTALAPTERKQLEFELDRLERIKKDYPYTKESLFKKLKQAVKGLTADEFEQWIADDRFDVREIDGERRFMGSSVSNLFFRHPELNPRRVPPQDTTQHDRSVWETCLAIRQAALAEKKPYVLPKRFHTTMTVTAKATPRRMVKSSAPGCRFPAVTHFKRTSDCSGYPPLPSIWTTSKIPDSLAYVRVHGLTTGGFAGYTRTFGRVFDPTVSLIFTLKTLGIALAVALIPIASVLYDRPNPRVRASIELRGLVRLFFAILMIEIIALVANYT